MKLFYLADIRLPTEKAHGIQIMKMCEVFARAGVKVTLIVPTRRNAIREDAFAYYCTQVIFDIKKIPTPDLIRLGRGGVVLQGMIFAAFSFIVLFFMKGKEDILYSRDEAILFLPVLFGWRKVFLEAHTSKNNKIALFVARCSSGIIPITQSLKEFFYTKKISDDHIIVAHDAVDLKQFQPKETKEECRKQIGLLGHQTIVLYAGHLYERKGVSILAEAASFLPNVIFVFVGGTDSDIVSFRSRYGGQKNILVLGRRPHRDIPRYLKAADIVVLPNSAKDPSSERYTSPMKLFEYMASGTPIVASDVSAVREILNEDNAVLVIPDNPRALANGIKSALSDIHTKRRSEHALSDVENKYTWDKRAEVILSFIKIRV